MFDVGQFAIAYCDIGNLHILFSGDILVDIIGKRFVTHIDFCLETTVALVIDPVIPRFYEIVDQEMIYAVGQFLLAGPQDVLGTGA